MKGLMHITAEMEFEVSVPKSEEIDLNDVRKEAEKECDYFEATEKELKITVEYSDQDCRDYAYLLIEYEATVEYTKYRPTYYDPGEYDQDGIYEEEWNDAYERIAIGLENVGEVEWKRVYYDTDDGKDDYQD